MLLCLLCFGLFRIGEAAVPGPVSCDACEPDSLLNSPVWALPDNPTFCLRTSNPGGLSNKFHFLQAYPLGWHHMAETHTTKMQQCALQKHLKSLSLWTGRNIRTSLGEPAPLRPGSSRAGAWTGVLNFADAPPRSLPCDWPADQFSSGRALISSAFIVTAATIYAPPQGPTFPRAKQLSESLLEPITSEVVLGRSGPRAILGDFNTAAGSLDQMKIWQLTDGPKSSP